MSSTDTILVFGPATIEALRIEPGSARNTVQDILVEAAHGGATAAQNEFFALNVAGTKEPLQHRVPIHA